jgi:glycosyltransferase involved in cell wall biosynthesis
MILNFLAPTTTYAVGGTMAMFEFANGLVRRGHEVHVTHVQFFGERPGSIDALDWCELDPALHHHFPDHHPSSTAAYGSAFDDGDLPPADFVFCFDDRIPQGRGLPLMWVQAVDVLGPVEAAIFAAPCPKVCISRWLVEVARERGAAANQCVHIPYGLRHEKYRLLAPIEGRRRRISMLYNSHPTKGAVYGLEAIARVLDRVPDADAITFGTTPLEHELHERIHHVRNPTQSFLVEEIYNTSSVFVSSSPVEGFGLAGPEAMACGAALVTAANGGSADYAIHGETALVSPPWDAASLAEQIETLLLDDAARTAIAGRGRDFTERFDWARSAELLEAFLEAYGADPSAHR